MRISKLAAATAAAVVVAGSVTGGVTGSVHAQTLSIGATQAGAVGQIAATLSKLVSTKTPYQMRSQTMGGTQQYIPLVDAGEIDFGLSNMPQYWMAKTGTGLSKGTKYDNLVLVANMMKFTVAPLVANDSPIRKTSDLKGKRAPYGFKAAPLFAYISESFLANGNLTYKDVRRVPTAGLAQSWTALKEGKLDYVVAAIGTGAVSEMDVTVKGGVRFLSMDTSPEAVARVEKVYPKSYLDKVEPSKELVGVRSPVYTLHYDFLLWTNKKLSDEIVYNVAKAMYENQKELRDSSPLWRSHSSATMAKDQGTPYHPGAVRFYKEAGLLK